MTSPEPPVNRTEPTDLVAGRCRIFGEVGRGGMGIVYRAEDTRLRRTAALRFLPAELTDDPEGRARFLREAQAAADARSDPWSVGCVIYEMLTGRAPFWTADGTVSPFAIVNTAPEPIG
jgi:serine/threonine protein kinase